MQVLLFLLTNNGDNKIHNIWSRLKMFYQTVNQDEGEIQAKAYKNKYGRKQCKQKFIFNEN